MVGLALRFFPTSIAPFSLYLGVSPSLFLYPPRTWYSRVFRDSNVTFYR